MAIDLIARAAAQAAATSAQTALAASSAAAPAAPFLFADLAAAQVAASTSTITTAGYSAIGRGAASYVSDALATPALAAAHPRCCRASVDGRFFRLLPNPDGAITVAQTGALGSGNDRPAFQAALDYAAAMGIRHVRVPDGTYDLWCSQRTTAQREAVATDGSMLCVTASVRLSADTCAVLRRRGPTGGAIDSDYQTVGGSPWRGGGIHLYGDSYPYPADEAAWTIQWFEMENIELDGGGMVGTKVATSVDASDKGIFFHNAVRRVTLKNCRIHHFYHELLYGGNQTRPVGEIHLQRVKAHGSGHAALSFGMARKVVDLLGEYGDAAKAAELSGSDYTFVGTRFFDAGQLAFAASDPRAIPADQDPAFPAYGTELRKTTLIGVEAQNVDSVSLGSYTYGELHVIDGRTQLADRAGEIALRLTATLDQANGLTALAVTGPETLPAGTAAGCLPRNIKIDLKANVTRKAQDAGRGWTSVLALGGHLDPETVQIHIEHADRYTALCTPGGTVSAMPLVRTGFAFAAAATTGQVPGATRMLDADTALAPYECGLTVNPGAAALALSFAAVGAGGAYEGIAHGQRYKVFYGANAWSGGTGKITFARSGTNLALTRNRTLWQAGDWLEFEYNARLGKWTDVGGYASDVLTAAMTLDAPSIANGETFLAAIAVPGAALGDRVEVAFGRSLKGMIASAYVSAADNVTVTLSNLTGAAIDLASTTVSVAVRRA